VSFGLYSCVNNESIKDKGREKYKKLRRGESFGSKTLGEEKALLAKLLENRMMSLAAQCND